MELDKLINSLDNILMKSFIETEVVLAEDFRVKIKTLTQGDLIEIKANLPEAAKKDILLYSQLESLEILVKSITHVNGVDIIKSAKEETPSSENFMVIANSTIKKLLAKLPSAYINKIIEEYNQITDQQNKIIEEGFGKKVENF